MGGERMVERGRERGTWWVGGEKEGDERGRDRGTGWVGGERAGERGRERGAGWVSGECVCVCVGGGGERGGCGGWVEKRGVGDWGG